jgi:hypothetical protein
MRLLRLLPLLLLPAFVAGPSVPDTSLDGLWFKATFKAKGVGVNAGSGQIFPGSVSMPAYVELVFDEPIADGTPATTHYKFDIWVADQVGTYSKVSSGESDVVVGTGSEYIAPDVNVFPSDGSNSLSIRATLVLHVKRDKNGVVTSAKLSTLGGEVYAGIVDGFFSYGGVKLTGKSVAVDKLPFTPS